MSLEPVSNDGIGTQSLGSETMQPLDVNKDTLLAQEIVRSRTAWYFQGRCGLNTPFPGGKKNTLGISEELGEGTEPSYYNKSAKHINIEHPNLYFAAHLIESAYPDGKVDPETMVIVKTTSKDAGFDEVLISGKFANVDDRQSASRYFLISRITIEQSQQLFKKLIESPDFINEFLKASFPNIDSSKTEYNGLYRLMAKRVSIIDDVHLNELSRKYPASPSFPVGTYSDPRIPMESAQDVIDKTAVKLTKPTGVGTLNDFEPTKSVYNEKWKKESEERIANRNI